MATIVYWRSKEPDEYGASGEYIIMTDERVTKAWIRENTRPGFECNGQVEADIPCDWPLNWEMKKAS